jgi:hypothetical protein
MVDRTIGTFKSVAFALPVQGLMLAELLEHDHGQEARAGPPSYHSMNGAGAWLIFSQSRQENFPRRRNHFPLARRTFQRPGYVLAQFAQPIVATALASRRRIDYHRIYAQARRAPDLPRRCECSDRWP